MFMTTAQLSVETPLAWHLMEWRIKITRKGNKKCIVALRNEWRHLWKKGISVVLFLSTQLKYEVKLYRVLLLSSNIPNRGSVHRKVGGRRRLTYVWTDAVRVLVSYSLISRTFLSLPLCFWISFMYLSKILNWSEKRERKCFAINDI